MPRRRRSPSSSAHDSVDPAQPIGDRDQLFGPVGAHPDDDQGGQPLLSEPDVEVHPIGPHIDIVPIGQAAGHERLPLSLPLGRQPGDHRRRQPGRGPKEAFQRRDEVPELIPCRYSSYLGRELAEPDRAWVSDVRVERIAEASHWVQADASERVNQLMVDFLLEPIGG
jgi:hypothetical protein